MQNIVMNENKIPLRMWQRILLKIPGRLLEKVEELIFLEMIKKTR